MNLRPLVYSVVLFTVGSLANGEEGSTFVLPEPEQINKAGERMRTPLMQAVRRGNADEVQALLAAGADAKACNHAGQNALMTACYRRFTSADAEASIRLLITAGADINSRDNEGRTPLMFSLMSGDHGWMVPVLTSLGADINARDNAGRTPLMYAVQGYMADEAWRHLMAAKPDIHARDNSGKQAIDYTLPTSNNRKRFLELEFL